MGIINRAIIVVAFLVALLYASVLSVQAAEPVHVDGNPTCELLAPQFDFEFLFEYKLDPVVDAEVPLAFSDISGALTVDETDLQTFDFAFSGNFAPVAVFAKAGNQGNLYLYNPEQQTSDVDLHGPYAPNGETFFDLGHITFCIVATQAQNESLTEVDQTPPTGTVPSNPDGLPSETEAPQSEEDASAPSDEPQSTDQAPSDPEELQPTDETSTEGEAQQTADDTPSDTDEPQSGEDASAPSDEPQSTDQAPSDPEESQPADETSTEGDAQQTSDDTPSDSDMPQSGEDASSDLGPSQEVILPIFLPVIHG